MAHSKVTVGLLLAVSLLTTGLIPEKIVLANHRYTAMGDQTFQPASLPLKADVLASTLLEEALQVSAEDLAESYLRISQLLNWLPLVASGLTIQTSDMQINPGNVDEVKAELTSRVATYETAINHRGYKSIGGFYKATATSSCGRTKVAWASTIATGEAGQISIVQNGFHFQIVHRFEGEKPLEVKVPGIIVETKMSFMDPMNSDFGFTGTVTPDGITVIPNTARNLAA